jgi:integrase
MGTKEKIEIVLQVNARKGLAERLLRIVAAMVRCTPDIAGGAKDGIIAKIRPDAMPLDPLIDEWEAAHAASLSEGTRGQYRRRINEARLACQWHSTGHIQRAPLVKWLQAKVSSGEWKAVTHNCALGGLQSFLRWAKREGHIPEDPLAEYQMLKDDKEDGSRAASTDELRRIIAWAAGRQQHRKGTPGANAAFMWLLLATTGMRIGTLGMLRWSHFMEENSITILRWTPDINKSGHRRETVLNAEAAGLLREHREAMKEYAKTTPTVRRKLNERRKDAHDLKTNPDDPEAVVFPVLPPRATFDRHAQSCGIEAKDRRGRGFSPHSTRKWFETTMSGIGAPQGLIDYMILHTGHVRSRYNDPPLPEQFSWVERLPKLWPGNYLGDDTKKSDTKPVASGDESRYIPSRESTGETPSDNRIGQPARPAPSVDSRHEKQGFDAAGLLGGLLDGGDARSMIPKVAFRYRDPQRVADLLRAIVAFLEDGGDGNAGKPDPHDDSD